jgi:oxygen-independent coproporphyrinogen-3 oxidase
VTPEDLFRGEIVEELMCRQQADLQRICARHGRTLADLSEELALLQAFEDDGVVVRQGPLLTVTTLGAPFLRSVCAVFDVYLDRSQLRHSATV